MKTIRELTYLQKQVVIAAYEKNSVSAHKQYGFRKRIILHLVRDGILEETFAVPPRYILTPTGYELAETLNKLQSITAGHA